MQSMPAEPRSRETPAAGTKGDRLRTVRPRDPRAALGMAVSYLMTDPVFARLPFGRWSRVLVGQVNRGHYLFVVKGETVVGFAGWALTGREKAEAWLTRNRELPSDEASGGDCVLINAWKASSPRASRALVNALRNVILGKHAVYAKRFYANGRVRPLRLPVNEFVAGHLARGDGARSGTEGEGRVPELESAQA